MAEAPPCAAPPPCPCAAPKEPDIGAAPPAAVFIVPSSPGIAELIVGSGGGAAAAALVSPVVSGIAELIAPTVSGIEPTVSGAVGSGGGAVPPQSLLPLCGYLHVPVLVIALVIAALHAASVR